MVRVPLDGSLVADITRSVGAITPYDAYAGWASQLGVSGTTSLESLEGDDYSWPIVLASVPVPRSTTAVASFSSEGALGLYLEPPADTDWRFISLVGVHRMTMSVTQPDVMFAFRPQSDLRSAEVQVQRAGSVTILRGLLVQYMFAGFAARFAIRLNGTSARFIFEPVDQPLDFMLFKGSSDTSVFSESCAAGALVEFATTLSSPTAAGGFTSTAMGSPELMSRLALGAVETSFGVPSTPVQALSTEPTTMFGLASQAHRAAGFASTAMGAPMLIPAALGSMLTAFGIGSIPLNASGTAPDTMFGLANQAHPGAGFECALFGSPAILPSALGFRGTTFGLGAGSRQVSPTPALGRIASFGTPNSPYNQTLTALPRDQETGWGRPFGFRTSKPVVNIAFASTGVSPGAIGRPAYAGSIVAVCAGSAPETTVGFPDASRTAAVTALSTGADPSTAVGNPSASLRYRSTTSSPRTEFGLAAKALSNEAAGTRSTSFGTPASARSLYALGTLFQTRYGLASATRAGDHPAVTRYAYVRFGHPRATLVKGERAIGAATTTFGAHSSARRTRGLHIPPSTGFGSPRVTRTPSC